jgi:hypothetical protein
MSAAPFPANGWTLPGPAPETSFDLIDIVGAMITGIDAFAGGWRLRTSTGRSIIVTDQGTFDGAGMAVRLPGNAAELRADAIIIPFGGRAN